ncbi:MULTISPECIES: hypothetical protein [unclassified Micromonospora]
MQRSLGFLLPAPLLAAAVLALYGLWRAGRAAATPTPPTPG